MNELNGKTVVVSGGAEGIGLGMARILGGHGMNVVLADINAEQLQKAEQGLSEQNIPVLSVALDAGNIEQWQDVAEQAIIRFGKVHMLVNNAGVSGTPGSIEDTHQKDWRWVVDVNLMGVVNGTQVMVPLMKQHGEGGWLINVASMAGFGGLPGAGPYSATKAAVVAISEGWRAELAPENIHVSVLCPGFVKTRIHQSHRNKPAQYAKEKQTASEDVQAKASAMDAIIGAGMDPDLVGERVVEAIMANELYIFTHPNYRPVVQARSAAIDAAFARAEESPLLADDVVPDIPFLG